MRGKKTIYILLIAALWMAALGNAAFAAADKTTKYRVYQNEQALAEFSDLNKAKQYAQQFRNSYIEEIESRKWVWHNLPRYKVYQFDLTLPGWEFATLEEAVAVARNYAYASVRDLHSAGWVWDSYPRYRLYQGDITLDHWAYKNLEDAVKEAVNWGHAHIIDLNTNRWIWDNIPQADKEQLRQGEPVYRVYQGNYSNEAWIFAYLEDAVNEALKWAGSYIIDTSKGNKVVYENAKNYQVFQEDKMIGAFTSLDEAIGFASYYWHARIKTDGREIWNNYGYYQVYQDGRYVEDFSAVEEALAFALGYAGSSIRTYDGESIWNNLRKLMFFAWHGSSSGETIKNQLQHAAGLDVSSPTWFHLSNESGDLQNLSNKETAAWLKSQGYAVHPLVSNQFNSALTSKFLASPKAQETFIGKLISAAKELGADGLNIDFESMSGKDRDRFTAFIQKLTEAAHAQGLIVSIDLPRGDVRWNHLGAYDHEKLGQIVDYVMIMAYDQHYSGSDKPGSVSGLQWAEEGVKQFLSYGIPREKLVLGMPLYVREWKLNANGGLEGNRSVYLKDIADHIAGKKTTATWDPEFQQYRIEYKQDGYTYVFWLENEESAKARLEIAKKYDLAGVALWRLGYDTKSLWDTMLQHK